MPASIDVASLDLRPSARALELRETLVDFMHTHVFPAEHEYEKYRASADPGDSSLPPVVEELKKEARSRGLWNLFLPAYSRISQLDYAGLAEITGWSLHLAPEATNGQAPDTGNMELLHMFGTEEQQARWLEPLKDGVIRSAFSMTEVEVASSDATNIQTRIRRDGDEYVIDGRKWWTSGASDPRCELLIVMGKTDPDAATHRQQSMVLVPVDTPGVTVVRDVPVFGRHDQHGHCEIVYDNVRVPVSNILGEEGAGFAIAQARLGPGRIHHCMRALGAAERALGLMTARAQDRIAFGKPLAEQGVVQQQIAESRIAIDQARLLCQYASKITDVHGNKAAAPYVSAAKVSVPRVALEVIDRAIQVHGGAGVSDDVPLAAMYGWHRAMRIFDGPDEVHLRTIAKAELRKAHVRANV
ncbi:acyl-CoA dehydrogenase family protein [Rhodococcus sp. BP-252]|uniref:Acyl-CoA dehydrogenase n=1 Tax=Rhodococcoides kyotonense TaxID=398843 RepID=A0A177YHL5_9NOCA|nr:MULTISPECIES: acyl-CoA dehydrogenase family protein [Rhodococcus]MBY6414211.1 acyl-CoA dehydrogenase family protein [Rhodococcus sp. BP-320]MBY6418925.1 acyl-CoA dehydrogenase family protein [Rhodococcus sp. BP-321]MBY6423678.1 acyl-CoA dehydrogenase family protein [Rhodococcus sp. BP-324]MBY6429016.1 acyl-CoA dehydrogenase family protein [Rhodococcus sp. BP-323]MBY6434021.1 acyl-CoA dehydrogenase family protein [Rhodococcus sp. BP-322]